LRCDEKAQPGTSVKPNSLRVNQIISREQSGELKPEDFPYVIFHFSFFIGNRNRHAANGPKDARKIKRILLPLGGFSCPMKNEK
jgi:hypothetical protein